MADATSVAVSAATGAERRPCVERSAAGDLKQDQLVAFHARFPKERHDPLRQIAGESIVETAADQQERRARVAVIDPVDQSLLVARLPFGFELGEGLGRQGAR